MPARLLCPLGSPGKNIVEDRHFLLQGIFLTQGLNPHLWHWQADALLLIRLLFLCWNKALGKQEAPVLIKVRNESDRVRVRKVIRFWTSPGRQSQESILMAGRWKWNQGQLAVDFMKTKESPFTEREGFKDRARPGLQTMFFLPKQWKGKLLSWVRPLWDPMAYTFHGILQARILEWVAFPFSRDLPNPGIELMSPALKMGSLPTDLSGNPTKAVSDE